MKLTALRKGKKGLKLGFTAVFILLLCTTSIGHAANKKRFGFGVNYGNFSVDDPAGSTDDESLAFLSALMTIPVGGARSQSRLWLEANYRDFTLPASQQNIGQEVTSIAVEAIGQYGFNVSSTYRPWLGAGVGLNFNEYSNRHQIDADGFLAQRYSDRNETDFDVLLNAGLSFKRTSTGFYFGLNLTHHITLNNGIDGTRLMFFMLF